LRNKLKVERSEACKQPACQNPHPSFNMELGDRAKKTEEEALDLAEERESERGPQLVTLHHGWVLTKGVWFIQDARPFGD
jgi:hypothetical protein